LNILAIDTSTDWCGVSLFQDGRCKDIIEKYIPKKHSEFLPIFFESIIKNSNFDKNNLDAIAVTIGPGSFTGLRIGLGFSKGIAYALNKPVVPVPTLDVIGNDPDISFDDFLVLLFSHRNIVYVQKFLNKKPKGSPKASNFNEIDLKSNIVHYGCDKLLDSSSYVETHPSAEVVGNLALQNFKEWKIDEPYTLASNYISPFEIG
tara:strand:+ start:31 stop:642 length:612 start_codon:yes stop_codon:yes gene_type:complete